MNISRSPVHPTSEITSALNSDQSLKGNLSEMARM